jgi:hypothetical protein
LGTVQMRPFIAIQDSAVPAALVMQIMSYKCCRQN